MLNRKILQFFLFALILAATTTAFQAASHSTKTPTNHVGTIAAPDGLSMEGIQKAILKAAVGRKWEVKEKIEGKVVIQLVHRGYDSTLTFHYTKNEVKVYSDSWTIKKSGAKKKKKDPDGWIENLKKDLPVFMNRELYN